MKIYKILGGFLLYSALASMPLRNAIAQTVPDASACLKVEVGEPANRGIRVGEPGWAINLENTCTFQVIYLGCYSSPSPDSQGKTVVCSAGDRNSHIGLNTFGSKPGVFAGGGSITPGRNGRGSLSGWNPGPRPSVSVTLAACPMMVDGKYVRFAEVRFANGAITAKCEIGPYKEVQVIGM
jgi:hypothetical protein